MKTRITELYGIKYPIMLSPMGLISYAPLAAAVSNSGGLGVIAGSPMTPEEIRRNIAEIKQLTDKPFAVNIGAWNPGADELLDAVLAEGISILHISGASPGRFIKRAKRPGLIISVAVGTPRHAEIAEAEGADAVVVTGHEAGGHIGTIGSMVAVPAIANATKLPVVAAGGFCDANGLVAALALGADAIAMGTRLALTKESPIHDRAKQHYLAATVSDAVETQGFTGRGRRAIRNKLVDFLEGKRRGIPMPSLHELVEIKRQLGIPFWKVIIGGLKLMRVERVPLGFAADRIAERGRTIKGLLEGDLDWGLLSCGQVVGMINDIPTCQQVIEGIVQGADGVLQRVASQVEADMEKH